MKVKPGDILVAKRDIDFWSFTLPAGTKIKVERCSIGSVSFHTKYHHPGSMGASAPVYCFSKVEDLTKFERAIWRVDE